MRTMAARLLVILALVFGPIFAAVPAVAQNASYRVVTTCGTQSYTAGTLVQGTMDTTGKICGSSSASIAGSTSNASSGVATSSTNLPNVSYNYGFNGTTWDQLLVDGAKNLKIACITGCGGGGGATTQPAVSFRQTATASAVALTSNTLTNGIVCTSMATNTGTIYVGGSGVTTATGYPLAAGASISYGVANSNQVYMIGSNTSDILTCTGN